MFKYKSNCALLIQIFEVTTIFFCRKNELFSIQMLHNYITCIVQYIMIHNQCPATSRRTQRFAKCNFFIKKLNFGGHLGRHFEFLKTLKGAGWNLKEQSFPFQKIPKHLLYTSMPGFGIRQTI